MSVRRPRPRPKRSVSIPSLIAVVVAAVLVGLMLVVIMPVDLYSPTFGEGVFSEVHIQHSPSQTPMGVPG